MTGGELKRLRESIKISQKKLADATGIPYGTISGIESRPDQIIKKVENLEKLSEYFKSRGLLQNEFKNEVTPVPYEDYMMVEYVDLSVSAGYMGGSDVTLLPEKKKRLVPKEFESGNYLVVRVDGDSMDNGTNYSIPNGTEVLVKELEQSLYEKLPIRNNLFVICSREGNVLKQIVEQNMDLGYIRCHSYNDQYPDYNVPFEDITQIFVYRKIVSMRPPIPDINSK